MVSLRNEQFRLASVVTSAKPTQNRRIGEPVENRRSSQATACNKRCVMNVGDPSGSKGRVWSPNRYKRAGYQKAAGESDYLIVLRDGWADHMGKGVTVMCSLQRQLVPDTVGPDNDEPTFLQRISKGDIVTSTHVSMTEEPCAGKPHAGICAGDAG